MSKNIKIFIKWVAGPLLAIWLFYSLYQQVKYQPDLNRAISLIRTAPFGADGWKFWLVILLAVFNWGIEAKKWQVLIKVLQPMNYFTAFKSVLCGVTLSLNMPNRIGEYAGRIIYVKDGERLKAISVSMVGSMAQLIVTMLLGCAGLSCLFFVTTEQNIPTGITAFWLDFFWYASIIGSTFFLMLFFKLNWLVRIIKKIPRANRLSKYIDVLELFDAKILLRLLLLSLLRYIVFILQYILLLQVIQVDQNWWPAFCSIAVMFWILAVIPSFAIADLGIRGTVAKALFAYSHNTIGILAVTFGIWLINLFIPALAGSLLILGLKIKKEK